jgi:hypothetical protein
MQANNYPRLHNATWPGVVGKGAGSEPCISLETLLTLTAGAEVDGIKFDGIDIGLFEPHFNLDETDDGIKKLADKVSALNLNIGSIVAPVWPPAGGSAMGTKEARAQFVNQVRKAAALQRHYANWVFVPTASFASIPPQIRNHGLLTR